MADIFLSYARADETEAERVAAALREQGLTVWRDDQLPAHRAYADVIQEVLAQAKAVVVLWSREAALSHWVRAEADWARNAGSLVQARIDTSVPPLPFNQIQCADLESWHGDAEHAGWGKLLASVTSLAGGNKSDVVCASTPTSGRISVCVLPFANMSGEPEQEYFSDGISEDITTDLSNVSALSVTARNTAFSFKGKAFDVRDIARKVGVSHVLEGSVRKAGTRVRISAQLIDGTSGDHLWAERYDRELTDIFAIQDEISKAIVDALKVRLLPIEKRAIEQKATTSADAYNLYLMARSTWATGNHGDRRREERVVRICEKAVALDPRYAQAWALMAIAQSSLRYGFDDNRGDDGVEAAKRALSIDPCIAEAHCPIARHFAEREQYAEADAEFAKALSIDPNSWEVNKEAARAYFRQRRIDEAAACFKRATELMEQDYHAWGMLFSCYNALGDERGMRHSAEMLVKQVELALEEDSNNGAALSMGASGYAYLGQPDKAREYIDRALLVDPDNVNMRYNFACSLAASLKDADAALEMLGPVLAKAGRGLVRLAAKDTDFDGLRNDPRFQAMLAEAQKRIGERVPE